MGLIGLLIVILLILWLFAHVAIGPLGLVLLVIVVLWLGSGGYTRRGWY